MQNTPPAQQPAEPSVARLSLLCIPNTTVIVASTYLRDDAGSQGTSPEWYPWALAAGERTSS